MLNASNEYESFIFSTLSESNLGTIRDIKLLQEAEKESISNAVIERLYKKAVEKYDKLEFEDIPLSKGDITKLSQYNDILDSLELMKSMSVHDKNMANRVKEIEIAVDNFKSRNKDFNTCYLMDSALPIMLYNTIIMTILEYTSILLSAHITYVSAFNMTGDIEMEIDYNTNYVTTFESSIQKFNEGCKKGVIDKLLEECMRNRGKNFLGSTAITIGATTIPLVLVLVFIIPIIKELIYQFYYQKERLSKYLLLQSTMLNMNKDNVRGKDMNEQKKIIDKQKNTSRKLMDLSRKLSMDRKKAMSLSDKDSSKDRFDKDQLFIHRNDHNNADNLDFNNIDLD